MRDTIRINDEVSVGPQPSEDEIRSLRDEGFRSVVNFRTDGESDQPLSTDEEGKVVGASGLEYVNIPVSMESMGPETVDEFREQYGRLPKPVFAHCKSGKRAGAMVMMHSAVEQGMSGDETLEKAKAMGFECDQPELEQFVKSYVDGAKSS